MLDFKDIEDMEKFLKEMDSNLNLAKALDTGTVPVETKDFEKMISMGKNMLIAMKTCRFKKKILK